VLHNKSRPDLAFARDRPFIITKQVAKPPVTKIDFFNEREAFVFCDSFIFESTEDADFSDKQRSLCPLRPWAMSCCATGKSDAGVQEFVQE
jgi:hypothetical protein